MAPKTVLPDVVHQKAAPRNYKTLKYKLLSLAVASFFIGHSESKAQATESVVEQPAAVQSKASKSESNDSSKEENLRQGFSVQQSILLGKDSKWSTTANTGFSRTLDELSYTTWTVGGGLGYRLNEKDSVSTSLSYSARTDLEDSDPELFGIGDLSLRWTRARLWSNPQVGSVSSQVVWKLPTSTLSQRQTQLSSVSASLSLARPMPITSVFKDLTLLSTISVVAATHQYDRRARGPSMNSPLGLSYSGGATYSLLQKVNLTSTYSMYHRMEYDGYVQDIQTFTVQAVATLPEEFFLTGGYLWRDTVLTNDPFLFADKTSAYLQLSRAF